MKQATSKAGLKKILSRNIALQDADQEHLKYIWASYKKGDFEKQGLYIEQDLEPNDFKEMFIEYLQALTLDIHIILFDEKPIGMVLYLSRGRVLQIENLIWFSWASKRNALEGIVLFLDTARRTQDISTAQPYKVLIYSREKDKRNF